MTGPLLKTTGAAAIALSFAACGAPQAGPVEPSITALQAGSLAFRRATIRAEDAVLSQPVLDVAMRFNPAPCECPAFEVQLYGAWVRSGLVATRDSATGVGGVLEAITQEGATARLQIATRSVDTILAGGWTYPVWEVLTITPAREAF